MTYTRRALLAGLMPTALLAAACVDDPNFVRITAMSGPLARDRNPPTLILPRAPVGQGGTFLAALSGEGRPT